MVELFDQDVKLNNRHSSKGNQLKWIKNDTWYKADYTGYEGLAESVVSQLLQLSSLQQEEYVLYRTEKITYKQTRYNGCSSQNFLPDGWQLVTLERLFPNYNGKSLNKALYEIQDLSERLKFLVTQTIHITGLVDFGAYMSKLLTIDAIFLNEDRHLHNIAVLMDEKERFHYCPFFDHGAALLSDTTMDYPLGQDVNALIECPESKTFCNCFDEQLDIAEHLYGTHIKFCFNEKDINKILDQEPFYSDEIKSRVKQILCHQMRKYRYLFNQ